MMADDVKGIFGFMAATLGIATIVCFCGRAITSSTVYASDIREESPDWRVWQTWIVFTKRVPLLFAATLVVSTFMPSTKTIAAMIVLPKITSPQALDTMGKESRDIYELAKKALANLADDKPASTEKK
jgi:hypothetical protein